MIAIAVGRVVATRPHALEAVLPAARLGDRVRIGTHGGRLTARVDALYDGRARLVPDGATRGVRIGDRVETMHPAQSPLGVASLGRIIDPAADAETLPRAFDCAPVCEPLWTGVTAVDGLLTFGRGARIGVFGSPGTGKSTLLARVARATSADAVVIGLVGERRREAERWNSAIDGRSALVCATGDRTAAERVRAAELAFALAEELRGRALHVLLILDSLARTATSLREIALARGEAPGRGGFPPSVFSDLARLVERAGNARSGSLTLVATVLSESEGDDPLADAVRSVCDGHIVLDRAAAQAGRFPAIDVTRSLSRTMSEVVGAPQLAAAGRVRRALARLAESEDLRAAGLVTAGQDPVLDRAVAALPGIEAFLYEEGSGAPGQTLDRLLALADSL